MNKHNLFNNSWVILILILLPALGGGLWGADIYVKAGGRTEP